MSTEKLQEILSKSKNKDDAVKALKQLGYHNARFFKPTKGTDLQQIAKACVFECDEVDTPKYWLFGSFGEYNGYEWIWLEQTKKSPEKYNVTILVKEAGWKEFAEDYLAWLECDTVKDAKQAFIKYLREKRGYTVEE